MEIHHLRYFVRVAELLNFTRAAEDLSVAQPSLSQQVRKLEQELGFALFDRSPAGVRLTREGDLFLPHARAVLARLAEARLAAAEIRGVEQGEVTIGISPFAGAHVLPGLLRLIRTHLPRLTIRTREEGLGRLADLLQAGEIDLAMVLLPADGVAPADRDLTVTLILTEDLVVVLPADHALAGGDATRREMTLAELRDETWVLLTPEYGLRQQIVEECRRAGYEPRIGFESREVGILQSLVEAGLGLTILPASAVRRDLQTATRPLIAGGRRPQRRIGLALRRDRYVSIAACRVFDLVRAEYA